MPQMMPMSWMLMYFIILFFINSIFIIIYQSMKTNISKMSSMKMNMNMQMMTW